MSGLSPIAKGVEEVIESPAARKAVGGTLDAILQDIRRPFMTTAYRTQQLSPEVGGQLMKVAAAKDVAKYHADRIVEQLVGHMDPTKREIAGRIPLHARHVALVAKGVNPSTIRVPRLTDDELKYVEGDADLQKFITDYKTLFQNDLERGNAMLGIQKMEAESPYHGLFVNLRAIGHDFKGKAVKPGYWDATHGKNMDVPVDNEGMPQITGAGGYKGPAITERAKLLAQHEVSGDAHSYETDIEAQIRHLIHTRRPAVEKAKLIGIAQRTGMAIPWSDEMGPAPQTYTFKVKKFAPGPDGKPIEVGEQEVELPAVLKEWGATLDPSDPESEALKRTSPFAKNLVPRVFAEEMNTIEQSLTDQPGALAGVLDKVSNAATALHLSFSPTAAIRHSSRIMSILKNLPAAPGDWGGFALKAAGGPLGGYLNAMREIPKRANSEEGAAMFRTLLEHGGLRLNSFEGSVESDRKFKGPFHVTEQFLFGDPAKPPKWLPPGLKDYWGLDARARVTAAMLYKSWKPTANDAELADFARQFGNYTTALQPNWVKNAKRAGATFMGFQSQAIPTEVARALGNHGIDVSHLPFVQRKLLNALTLWNGSVGSVLSAALMTKMLVGYFPWEKKGKGIPLGAVVWKGRDGKERTIPLSMIDPAAGRALRLLGLSDAVAGKNPVWSEVNEVGALAGPAVSDAMIAATGKELHFIRPGELADVAPTMATPQQQSLTNLLARGAAMAGPLPQTAYDVATMATGGLPPAGRSVAGDLGTNIGLRALQGLTGETTYPTAPHGEATLAEKGRRAGAGQALEHAREQAMAAADSGNPDEIRQRLLEVIQSTPPQYRKQAQQEFIRMIRSRRHFGAINQQEQSE